MTNIQKPIRKNNKPTVEEERLVKITNTDNLIQISLTSSDADLKTKVLGYLHTHRLLITSSNHFDHIVQRKFLDQNLSIIVVICESIESCNLLANILILELEDNIDGHIPIGSKVSWWYKRRADIKEGEICGFVKAGVGLDDFTVFNRLGLPQKGVICKDYSKKPISADRYLILTEEKKGMSNQYKIYTATKNRITVIE